MAGYPTAMSGLWSGLALALRRLEAVAAEPEETLARESALESLRGFQYVLHEARETLVGVQPPPGSESFHEELAQALADARDVTADVYETTVSDGPSAASLLGWEWRGALFRVRLAQRRLIAAESAQPEEQRPAVSGRSIDRGAAAATALVVAGTAALATGAAIALWPLWAAGVVLVAAAIVVYRGL
jgi:hypothetical protein